MPETITLPELTRAEIEQIEAQYQDRFLVLVSIDGLALLNVMGRPVIEDLLASGLYQEHRLVLYRLDGAGLRAGLAELKRRGMDIRWADFVAINNLRADYLMATSDSIPAWLPDEERVQARLDVRELMEELGLDEEGVLAQYRWSVRSACMVPAIPEDLRFS